MDGGPPPSGSLAGVDPEQQQQLEAAAAKLDSTDQKQRLAGLEGMAAGARRLPAEAQLWVAAALAGRLLDANLKVQQQVGGGCCVPAPL